MVIVAVAEFGHCDGVVTVTVEPCPQGVATSLLSVHGGGVMVMVEGGEFGHSDGDVTVTVDPLPHGVGAPLPSVHMGGDVTVTVDVAKVGQVVVPVGPT